jgi:hypothetical protein
MGRSWLIVDLLQGGEFVGVLLLRMRTQLLARRPRLQARIGVKSHRMPPVGARLSSGGDCRPANRGPRR